MGCTGPEGTREGESVGTAFRFFPKPVSQVAKGHSPDIWHIREYADIVKYSENQEKT